MLRRGSRVWPERLSTPGEVTRWVASWGFAITAMMIVTKVIVVVCLHQGSDEGGVIGFWGEDLVAGFSLGAALGVVFGFFAAKSGTRRFLWFSLVLLGVGTALLATIAVYVQLQFGRMVSWQWAQVLTEGSDIRDSVIALVGLGPLLLFCGLAVVVIFGTLGVAYVLCNARRRKVAILGMVLGSGLGAGMALWSKPSPLQLHRNWAVVFVESLFARDFAWADSFESRVDPHKVLDAIVGDETPAPKQAYALLRNWAQERRQNVVLVVLETMAFEHIQIGEGKVANTPTMAKLSRRSVYWPRHYAPVPLSMPAIYNILCANYSKPWQRPITKRRPRIDCDSLSEVLVRHGYRAGLWHSGRFSYYDKDKFLRRRGFSVLHDATTMPGRERYTEGSWGLEEAAAVDALLTWVAAPSNKPFLAVYIPVYPHHPYHMPPGVPRKFHGQGILSDYHNAVYYVDRMIQRLVEGIAALGTLENTVVVLVGDHGEGFGQHPGSYMHGTNLYEEGVRTFALWYVPGALQTGVVDSRALHHVDVLPTLLDILGLPGSAKYWGVSAGSEEKRSMIPVYTGSPHKLFGFVDGRSKFIYDFETGVSQLFDVAEDPGEKRSLVRKYPERVAQYKARTVQFLAAQNIWEKERSDLEAPQKQRQKGDRRTWGLDLASCQYAKDSLAQVGKRWMVRHKGLTTVVCRRDIPSGKSWIVSDLVANGRERISGAWIEIDVQHIDEQEVRRTITHCLLNQQDSCHGGTEYSYHGGLIGGRLETTLRFVTFHEVPKNVEEQHVSSVEISYYEH